MAGVAASSSSTSRPSTSQPTTHLLLLLAPLLLFVPQVLTRIVPCTADQTQRAVSTLRIANRMVNAMLAQQADEQNMDYVKQTLAFQPVEVRWENWVPGGEGGECSPGRAC